MSNKLITNGWSVFYINYSDDQWWIEDDVSRDYWYVDKQTDNTNWAMMQPTIIDLKASCEKWPVYYWLLQSPLLLKPVK